MDNGAKTIAVVSHPGNGAGDIATRLQAERAGNLSWQIMPEVHMLGRNTADEQVTYDYLLGKTDRGPRHHPDGILALVHANQLPRQLYLASQLIDLRLPLVMGVLNMEEASRNGLSVDIAKLAAQFGVRGYRLDAVKGNGVDSLVEGLKEELNEKDGKKHLHWRPSIALADAYHHLDKKWVFKHLKLHSGARLIEGLRLLGVAKAVEEYEDHSAYDELVALLSEARTLLEDRKENWTMAEVLQRNSWIGQIIASSTTREERPAAKKAPFWRRMMR